MNRNYIEIESIEALQPLLDKCAMLRHYAFQSVDFCVVADRAAELTYTDCIFMGCRIPEKMRCRIDDNCYIFPALPRPYNIFVPKLYSAEELYEGYNPTCEESIKDCFDSKVYAHYIAKGKMATDIGETLSRSLHDHSISDALHDMLAEYDERDVVAVMGGHSLSRADAVYADVARISKSLTERGRLMIVVVAQELWRRRIWERGLRVEVMMSCSRLYQSCRLLHDSRIRVGWRWLLKL